jgi:hypothetical protein
VPAEFREAVPCEVCDEPHIADVERIDSEIRGICRRTGETFQISDHGMLHRVDGEAFARSLSSALLLDDEARMVRGLENVWKLGARRLNEARTMFFLTPSLGPIDVANTILEAVAGQSGASHSCLIVASEIGAVRLLRRKGAIVRLRDLALIDREGQLSINEAQLLAEIFPDINKPPRRGRPARPRERILDLLDEVAGRAPSIDASNESIREWMLKYKRHYKTQTCPVLGTFKAAIAIWNARRGS